MVGTCLKISLLFDELNFGPREAALLMYFRSSLWDRLISGSDELNPVIGLADLKFAIAADLERLLNARQAQDPYLLKVFPHVEKSVVNFGVADFAARSLSSSIDREEICRSIALAIERFDTRLSDVSVHIKQSQTELHKLAFDIKAVLKIADFVDSVNFDVLFDSAGMQYKLSGLKFN